MVLYKLVVAYNGKEYSGFQRQIDNATMQEQLKTHPKKKRKRGESPSTVQQTLETVLLHLYPAYDFDVSRLHTRFAGRTDKGVHARGQVVVVELPPVKHEDAATAPPSEDALDRWHLHRNLQARLPHDISIRHVEVLNNLSFNPRHDVVQKEYSYTLKYIEQKPGSPLPSVLIGTPFLRDSMDPVTVSSSPSCCCWNCPWPLIAPPDAIATQLCGSHNYRNFCHVDATEDHHLTIDNILYEVLHKQTERVSDELDFTIVTGVFRFQARKFHRSMVRKLVGYLVDVARGLETAPTVEEALNGERLVTIHTAPAAGLCLEYVKYNDHEG